jgi:ABC-type branched-subunit amino acid transport system ATPase component
MLEVSGLRKRFGGIVANDDVSIEVEAGSVVGLIGPNGSGKTTLFNCIVGDQRADAGSVRFAGTDLAGRSTAEIARLGLVRTFQQAHVYERLTCLENVEVSMCRAPGAYGALARESEPALSANGMRLLALVDLEDKAGEIAGRLSFGQRKLLELAMALANEPRMLLLDEPTAGINPALIGRVLDRLREVRTSLGVTMVVIEHNMRVVMELAEKIYCLAHGRVLACGTPDEIRGDARVIEAYLGAR